MKSDFVKYIVLFILLFIVHSSSGQHINRKQLVERHSIINTAADTLSSLSVGNGTFAFTVDITGLQSFPDAYAKGVPLGTQSEWGWHSFPNSQNYKFDDALKTYHLNGRDVKYAVQWNSPGQNKNAADYFRQNLHRLQLANIGLEIIKEDGTQFTINDVKDIHQTLNMWTGEIHSQFTVEDMPVEVITYCHQQQDAIGIKINSPLLQKGKIKIHIRLPYPTGNWADMGNNFTDDAKHQSTLEQSSGQAAFIKHQLDTTVYGISLQWNGKASITQQQGHYFLLSPGTANEFAFTCLFAPVTRKYSYMFPFAEIQANSQQQWKQFWLSGGAIDFSGSIDKRANELERRIVLSQYLTKIQCAGNNPGRWWPHRAPKPRAV